MGEMTAAFLIIGVPSVPRVFRTLFSQGSALRSLMSSIKLLSWTGRRPNDERQDGGSNRILIQHPFHGQVYHKPRGAWNMSNDESFDLLPLATAHIEAGRGRGYDENLPQNSIKIHTTVDVVN